MHLLIERQHRWKFELSSFNHNSVGSCRQGTEDQVGRLDITAPLPNGSNLKINLNLVHVDRDSEETTPPTEKTSKRRQSLNLRKRIWPILRRVKSMEVSQSSAYSVQGTEEYPKNGIPSGAVQELEALRQQPVEVEGDLWGPLELDTNSPVAPFPATNHGMECSQSTFHPNPQTWEPRGQTQPLPHRVLSAYPPPNNHLAETPVDMFNTPYAQDPGFIPDSESPVSPHQSSVYQGNSFQNFPQEQREAVDRRTSMQNSPVSPVQFSPPGNSRTFSITTSSPYDAEFSPVSSPSSVETAVMGQASPRTPGPITGLAVGYPPAIRAPRSPQGTVNRNTWSPSGANNFFSVPQSSSDIADSLGSSVSQTRGSNDSRQQRSHPHMGYPSPGRWDADSYDLGRGAHDGFANHDQQYHNYDEPPPRYQSLTPAVIAPALQNPIHNQNQGILAMSYGGSQANQGTLPQQAPRPRGPVPGTEAVRQFVRGVGLRPIPCDKCGQEFSGMYQKGNLKRHKKSQHPSPGDSNTDLTCTFCSKGYKRQDALKKHIRKIHNIGEKKKRRVQRKMLDSLRNPFSL